MKLSQVLFTLFMLVGKASVEACDQHFIWNTTTLAVECASEEVQNHWTEALAGMNPYDELVNAERLQLYNEWKTEAWAIVNNDNTSHFNLYKNINPIIKFYNTFASPDSCATESDAFMQKIGVAVNGILGSSVLDAIQNFIAGGTRRTLRGHHRELCSCGGCGGGYYCRSQCGCRRRRLDGVENLLNLIENTPERMEALVNSVTLEIEEQCEDILKDIAAFSGNIDTQCRNTLSAIRCDVIIEVWESLSLQVGSTEMFAVDMIQAMLLAASG